MISTIGTLKSVLKQNMLYRTITDLCFKEHPQNQIRSVLK